MSPEGRSYGRYRGRDAKGPDTRNSLAGLRYAMLAALETHARAAVTPKTPAQTKPFYIEDLRTAKSFKGCIHCHYVKEILWAEEKAAGTWNRDEIWTYPLPENVGIELEKDRGNVVKAVTSGSAAERAGLKAGDLIRDLNGMAVHSFADAQYALHRAPKKGDMPLTWTRGKNAEPHKATLSLAEGWRKTNITWRPSLLDVLPSMRLYGDDLNAKEKKALGLDDKRLAFRQDKTVHSEMQAVGVRPNDIILGLDDLALHMTMEEFLGYVRRNYLVGDRVTLNVIRDGKRVDLPLKLK